MARTVPLSDISIVMVAKKMAVTPALLHYYLGGRDPLTSGVMNEFYRMMVDRWPTVIGTGRDHVLSVVHHMYSHYVAYAGITEYSMLDSRFRIYQLVEDGQTDYGVEALELFTRAVHGAAAPIERTGIDAVILRDFIISSAHNTVTHRYPSENRDFILSRVANLDAERHWALAMTRDSILKLDAQIAFKEGIQMFLDAWEQNGA